MSVASSGYFRGFRIAGATLIVVGIATTSHLYFHAPCFDGTVSAVLMHDYLARRDGRNQIVLHPVNYHLNDAWATMTLQETAVVVDFLYHPDAEIWFDHHSTPFNPPSLEDNFRSRQGLLVLDRSYGSCSRLIWDRLGARNFDGRHAAMIDVADRIDSARYVSPEEAVLADSPALRINASLSIGDRSELEEYSRTLVLALLHEDLAQVATSPEVTTRFERFRALRDAGLARLRSPQPPDYARLEDDIFVFNVDGAGLLISRYAPFLIAPQARYSVGLVWNGSEGKITAMRNPWIEFPPIPLGDLFFQVFEGNGGGHPRVASARLSNTSRPAGEENVRTVLQAMRDALRDQATQPTAQ